MKRKTAIAGTLRKLALFTAAMVILTCGAAYAQMGLPSGGATSINPGMPSASSPAARSGIPLGATELGASGLSPPPFVTTSGLGVTTPSLGAAMSGPSLGTTTLGVTGPMSSFGNGLAPSVTALGSTVPSPVTAPTVTNRRVTNYGPGGTQLPPGTPPRFH